jgi:hypothetical protein
LPCSRLWVVNPDEVASIFANGFLRRNAPFKSGARKNGRCVEKFDQQKKKIGTILQKYFTLLFNELFKR